MFKPTSDALITVNMLAPRKLITLQITTDYTVEVERRPTNFHPVAYQLHISNIAESLQK